MNVTRLIVIVASLALAYTAHGQNRPERPGAGQDGAGGRPGGRQADPSRFVERIMRSDTDGDGRLSRDELSEGRFIAVFDQADANGDGFLEPKEITIFVAARGPRGGRPGEGRPGDDAPKAETGPSQKAFEDAMDQAGRALRGLRRTSFKPDTFDRDLKALLDLESSLIEARRHIAAVPMSEAAKAKFGSDRAAYQRSFQLHMVKSLMATLEVEMAMLEGDTTKAKEGVKTMLDSRNESHDIFE